MLENVVEKPWGTANNIHDDNIKIAGKTGTSQIDYTSEKLNMFQVLLDTSHLINQNIQRLL